MSEQASIAFLCHPYHRGGVTRWMADAAIAFAQKGYKVYFIAPEPSVVFVSGKGRETLVQMVCKGSAPVTIISQKVGREFEFGTAEYRAHIYRQLLAQLPVGVPVILSDDDTVWAAAAAMHLSYPLVGVLHADEPYYYNIARKYAGLISIFTCVSSRVYKTLCAGMPELTEQQVYTIPCGINLPPLKRGPASNDVLQLVYVGRITEYQKRVSDLVTIAANLSLRKEPDFHLHIIGDGADKTGIEASIEIMGLDEQVTFHGWLTQPQVTEKLNAADILLLTSDFEGTPIAMMEALAAGCAVVGTRVSGIEDYEQHAEADACYAVYEVGDTAAAADKICALATVAPALRQRSARKLAEQEFGMDICVARYEAAIATIQGNYTSSEQVKMPLSARIYSRLLSTARYLKVALSNRS